MTKLRAVAMMLSLAVASALSAQALYTTGFEPPAFMTGDVDGQNGWGHLGNSPTGGTIVSTPGGAPAGFGSQSLAIVMQNIGNFGVANNLYSPNIDPPAGETGSTREKVVVPNPQSTFLATLWYRTPSTPLISTHPTAIGRFAELDPSSRGLSPGDAPNRYASVRVFNTTNTLSGVPRVEMRWFTGAGLVAANVATLDWGQWYRFEYRILLVDGTAGSEPNDRFTLTIYDAAGTQLGSVCGSTWELGWKSGTFGGGATPRAINGFDFWALTGPNGTVAGYVDQLSMTTTSAAPLNVTVSGSQSVCFGGTTTLTANGSGGTGTITSYVWRDAANNIVGTSPTLVAPAGSYTVTVTDTLCMTASATTDVLTTCKATPVVTWSDPAPITYGTPLSATQLNATANVPGTFTYAPPAGTILSAGPAQALTTDFTPTDTMNYNSVNGTTVHIMVDKRPTTITIDDVSPATANAGQPVTVSFHLGNVFGTPGGTVTISDGTSSCTTAAAGTACTLTFASAGPHTLVATFSGDANHLGSSSSSVLYNVGSPRPTALVQGSTLVCSGDSAAIRVTLSGDAPWTLTWSDGIVETATASPHVRIVKPSQTTTYALANVQDSTGSGSVAGSATVTVLVVAPPSILDAPVVETGKPLTLHATPGYSSYQWFLNGTPIAGATSATLTIPSVARMDAGSYSVAGSRDGCLSAASAAYTLVLFDLPTDDAVIPVVGSTRGAAGSLFRTNVHLVNGSGDRVQGELTFLDSALPRVAYSLAPGETRFLDDLLPPSFNGLTSVNVRRLSGPLPTILAHVFNDRGALGNSGMIERVIPVEESLATGDRAVLVTPLDPVATRFNIGLRSLSPGLTVRVIRRSAAGAILGTRERTLPASSLVHESAATFLGAPIGGNESLTFEIVEGRGVIYGAATDNGTNDPNMQIATKVAPAGRSGRFVLPVAGAVRGSFNSRFATGLQLHNAGEEPLVATLTFRPAGASASASDAKLDVTVPAHGTAGIEDVIAAMSAAGLGSLDVSVPPASRPVMLARVYSIADAGQTSLMTPLLAEEDFLRAGEDGVVAGPHAPRASRFNIGIRTLQSGARLTATVRDAAGNVLRVTPLSFTPSYFMQTDAESLLGLTLHGDESVVFHVDEGSAAIYGVWTDNVTQDPAMHYATRP
jgi:hypothetical protein